MAERRPIDVLRDSGLRMDVGTEDDRSPVKATCVINNSMHVIKAKGIYRIQLADEIDPQRTNPAIPNTSQRVLSYGTDCDLVRQTLMTASRLFHSKLLGPSFPYNRPIDLTYDALKDIAAMHEMHENLAAQLKAEEASLKGLTPKNRALSIPTIGGVRVSVETFLQKADHALVDLFEIAKLFYPDSIGKKWFDSLFALVKEKYGADSTFAEFLAKVLPVLKLIRNARNCIEHPKANKYVEVYDITLLASGQLQPPALEVVHPETPQPLIAVSDFMAQAVEQIAGIFELMLAFLCGYPPNLEKAFGVRYGYGVYDGDRIVPFG
jgi:hypothetical protein